MCKRTKTVKARVLHKVVSFYSSRYPSNLDKWFIMGQLVNWLLVCGIVGVWKQVGIRGWLFLEDPTERRYDVMVHENQTYASLMDLVRTRYSVGTETAVCLTFEFPEWMRIPADVAWPPVDVREDGDVDLFMSVRLEIQDLKLMVTIGNNVVARYLFQRRDNYTIIGSSSGNLDVNVNPLCGISDVSHLPLRGVNEYRGGLTDGAAYWESILGQGEMTTGQQSLLGVCTDDDNTTQLRSPREGTESSTDSSAAPLNAFPPIAGSGVIRLKEGIHQPVANPSLALTIVGQQKRPPSILDYITKGKGKVSEVGVVDKTQVSASGGSLSPSRNPNFADPLPYDDSADEDTAAEGNQHLFVRQVFMDRTAFKTHMSLYALAKKFPFVCRRSEPGKMVLACKGTNCKWRVYASKLAGCPTFQIKRVDEEHNCTVDERGDFKRHATSNLIGEMVRNKVVSVGVAQVLVGGAVERITTVPPVKCQYEKV
ncbi:hypothetical protein HID58_078652 [Brassica napus]|uniref:Transposase MuDR plant domain-containing protein n=1 Tax=Brassica napus TaxID=3708 RepID=A0ABQ7YUL6_BRANA|nr:hypothetical protein HID58_078652 [Brassica napus]